MYTVQINKRADTQDPTVLVGCVTIIIMHGTSWWPLRTLSL